MNLREEADSVAKAQGHLNTFFSFEKEYEHVRNTRMAALRTLAGEIINDNYHKKAEITAREGAFGSRFDGLSKLAESKRKALEDDLAREKHKDKLRIDFASAAQAWESYSLDHIEGKIRL